MFVSNFELTVKLKQSANNSNSCWHMTNTKDEELTNQHWNWIILVLTLFHCFCFHCCFVLLVLLWFLLISFVLSLLSHYITSFFLLIFEWTLLPRKIQLFCIETLQPNINEIKFIISTITIVLQLTISKTVTIYSALKRSQKIGKGKTTTRR